MQTLPNSGLKVTDHGETGWVTHHNFNVTRLNDVLLNLSALLDVTVSGLSDKDALIYNGATQKWEPKAAPGGHELPTTTTTTSSSTTTTSSSSSSTTTTTT